MPQIAAFDDVKHNRKQREVPTGGLAWRTHFIVPPEGAVDAPVAFLAEGTRERVIRPHFHQVDQFQVIVSGGGILGRHPLSLHAVHFARAYTPYGPIHFADEGLGFLTLRAHWDPGAQYLPAQREKLEQIPNRKPWQATEAPTFVSADPVGLRPFAQLKDDRGLGAYALRLKPNARALAPAPTGSNGQYLVITRGSLLHGSKEHRAITIVFVQPDEAAFDLQAGAEGLDALVLSLPRVDVPARLPIAKADSPHYRVWQCELCAFSYDEAKGLPEEGIAPGTRWEDVPEDWICPDCAASKGDFQMRVVA